VALGAARVAGRIHLRRLSRIRITRKTNAIDLVTEADRESEQAVIWTLNRAFPDHAILAEESGANARPSEHRWIIDPLDGTTNFAHGFPQFCVSIAYERRGRLELAVVYDAGDRLSLRPA
jgi:myo-inositol-1(or 4)-monophosphatase